MVATDLSVAPGRPVRPASRSIYSQLLRQVKAAGLLERRYGYYLAKIAVTGGLLIIGWGSFVLVGKSWWPGLIAAFLAFVLAQLRIIAPDAAPPPILCFPTA